MPEVVEMTVYTLEELQALEGRAYEQALERVRVWANEGGESCQWITEYLNLRLGEEKIGDFKMGGWDYDRHYAHVSGDVQISVLMTEKKLRGKHRAFWNLVEEGGVFDTYFSVNSEKSTDYGDDFAARFEECLYRYTDLEEDDPKRYALLQRQIEAVGEALHAYVEEVTGAVYTQMRAEVDWRYTDEFAVQEAEAMEMRFLANGDIWDH